MSPKPPLELARSSGSLGSSSHQLTPVESFKRSIKWDSSQFYNFKEGKHWDTRRRNALATDRAQDVDKVLDPDYAPLNQEEMSIFNENFSTTLQTDLGKKFVREYEEDFDTQMIYKNLHGFYATSVGARVSESDMLSYITSEKFDSWKGTIESFILNWQDQVPLHESIVDADSYFSENQKKILLENAVASVKPLRSVKYQADQTFAHTGKLLDYDQHSTLLLSTATNYDLQFMSSSSRNTRNFYNAELGDSDFVID